MKEKVVEWIRCPLCTGTLTLTQDTVWKALDSTEDVWEGFLECTTCSHKFPIIKGVLILIENFSQYISSKKKVFEMLVGGDISPKMRDYIVSRVVFIDKWESDSREDMTPLYIWAHYDEVTQESMLTNALKRIGFNNTRALSPHYMYSEIIAMIPKERNSDLPALDVGCSVGRMTHALAARSTFAVGIDYSFEAVRRAREITQAKDIYEYTLFVEGTRKERRRIDVSEIVKENVDFIVSDANKLPFPSNFFGIVLSLNMLDVVQHPLMHLEEVHRVLKEGGHYVTCDPYNWRGASTAQVTEWIGGKERGPHAGESPKVLRTILQDHLTFNIEYEKDLIPWLFRYDQRYFSIWLVDCLRAVKSTGISNRTAPNKK